MSRKKTTEEYELMQDVARSCIRQAYRAGYTHASLSRATGIANQSLCEFVNGNKNMELRSLCVIAKAIGVRPWDMVHPGRKGEKNGGEEDVQ